MHGRPVVHSMVQLVLYDETVHLITDYYQLSSPFWQERGLEPVMHLGGDSGGLAYGAPRHRRYRRALHLRGPLVNS